MILRRGSFGFVMLAYLFAGSALPAAQPPRVQSVSEGVYTDQQALRGRMLYDKRCSSCHGTTLNGRTGPALAGDDFLGDWDTRPLQELADKIRKTMPRDDSERLTAQETVDLLAYILQVGKFPAGRAELASAEPALKRLSFPPGAPRPRVPPPQDRCCRCRLRQCRPGDARDSVPKRQYSVHCAEYRPRGKESASERRRAFGRI